MVGNDNSSATNGSSVASVAGKNRFPANPCAETGSVATRLEDAAGELRLELDLGPNRTTRWQDDGRRIELSNDASRQMLEHLALEAVVIDRVTRTSRNIGSVSGVLVSRR